MPEGELPPATYLCGHQAVLPATLPRLPSFDIHTPMKFPHPIPAGEIARMIGATVIGDASMPATGLNEIHKVTPGDITFSDLPKYFRKALESEATVIILNEAVEPPRGKVVLVCDEPFEAYNALARHFRPFQPLTEPISASAKIDPTAVIEPNVIIGHEVVIGPESYIQAGAIIHSHVVVGARVRIHSGAIIGTDAFYYKRTPDGYVKWWTCGRVVIEDDVEIGAGCTINKGVSGDTRIGAGTKIDSQVHIGHDAVIGKNCLIAGQAGISGNTTVGDHTVIYGQAGLAQNLHIGSRVLIGAKSGVSKDIPDGKVVFGYPADDIRAVQRQLAALRQLPEWMKNHR